MQAGALLASRSPRFRRRSVPRPAADKNLRQEFALSRLSARFGGGDRLPGQADFRALFGGE